MTGSTKIPGNWTEFLKNSTNKEELFLFLAQKIEHHQFQGKIYVTRTYTNRYERMPYSNHEEADTRLMVHLLQIVENGGRVVEIRTGDTEWESSTKSKHAWALLKTYG